MDLHQICILEEGAGLIPPWNQDFVLPPEILASQVEPARWITPSETIPAGKAKSSYSGCFFFLIDACMHCNQFWLKDVEDSPKQQGYIFQKLQASLFG